MFAQAQSWTQNVTTLEKYCFYSTDRCDLLSFNSLEYKYTYLLFLIVDLSRKEAARIRVVQMMK